MTSNSYFGLDFGTSNTAISRVVQGNNQCELIPLEGKSPVLPSAIFYSFEYAARVPVEYGNVATECYIDQEFGRYFRSLKSILGSKIVTDRFMIKNEVKTFSDVMEQFLCHVKLKTEAYTGEGIDSLVVGRPVYFVDHDVERDALAQEQLKAIVNGLGVKHVEFQYEPIAAALSFEQSLPKEELALIVDMGGGTSDFTVVRIGGNLASKVDRSSDILSNNGIHIGGTDLDKFLSLSYVMPELGSKSINRRGSEISQTPFADMATWHRIHMLYNNTERQFLNDLRLDLKNASKFKRFLTAINRKLGHAIAYEVENAKISLSSKDSTLIDLSDVEKGLEIGISREEFEGSISSQIDDLRKRIQDTVSMASVKPAEITQVFFTGGTTGVLAIQDTVKSLFPNANIVEGEKFSSVAQGLSLDAKRKFS